MTRKDNDNIFNIIWSIDVYLWRVFILFLLSLFLLEYQMYFFFTVQSLTSWLWEVLKFSLCLANLTENYPFNSTPTRKPNRQLHTTSTRRCILCFLLFLIFLFVCAFILGRCCKGGGHTRQREMNKTGVYDVKQRISEKFWKK